MWPKAKPSHASYLRHTFAYVQGLRGPEPQVWHDKPFSAAGKPRDPLQSIELPDEYGSLPIKQLEQLYPYKGAYDVT